MAIPRIRPQFLWGAHFFVYFVFLGFLTSSFLPFSMDVAKPLAIGWFAIIMLHTMAVFGAFGGNEPHKREMEEKPKRRLELSDDGELVEVDDSADGEQKKRLMGD